MDCYQGQDGLNATLLRMALRFNGAHLIHQIRRFFDRKRRADFKLGSLIHELWLEPEAYQSNYAVLPGKFEGSDALSRKKRAGFQSTAKATGKDVLPESLHLNVLKSVEALDQNVEALELLSQCQREVSLYWKCNKWDAAKARLDLLGEDVIVDLKCYHGGRSEPNFLKSMAQQFLGLQLVWYQEGAKAAGVEVSKLGHLILDPETNQVRLRWMTSSEIKRSKEDVLQAIHVLQKIRAKHPDLWHRSVS